MPINPNVAQPMVEATTEELDQAYSMQNMIEGGVNPHIAENIIDTKALQVEVAELKSSLEVKNEKLRNSRRLNKVLGVVAVAAAAVAVWSPFSNDSKETTRTASTPVAANTSEANKTVESNNIFGKLGNAFKVKEAEAKATPASATKTTEDKLQDRIEHADKATSVAFAVKRANPTNANVKAMIEELADGKKIKKADNQRDAYGSLDNAISLKKVTSAGAALGVALNAEANKGVAIATANQLNGKDPLAASDMTKKQALESIVNDLTKKSTTFRRTTVSGTQNHGFNGESVYRAGVSEAIPALEVTVDGKKVYFKLVCLNGQYKLERTDTPTSVTKTPTSDTPTSKEKTPLTSIIDTPDRNPEDKPNDKPEDKPKEDEPKKKITPKVDKNDTPAGVPGHNKGTPDKAGEGPAGQTPGADGFLPQEDKPAAPPTNAPDNTPQQPSSETQNRPPAQEGTGPTNAPGQQAPGTSNEQNGVGTIDPNAAFAAPFGLLLAARRRRNGSWKISEKETK